MLISLHQIQKSFSDEVVLKNIDLTISAKDRIGLLGINGVGKTTLLNIISGELPYDAGEYSVKRNLSIGYLKQNEALNTENTLQEEIQSALSSVYEMRADLEILSQELASAEPNTEQYAALSEKYETLSGAYTAADGYHADVRIQIVLNGLGFGTFDLTGKVKTLSGGEKIRFAMAKVLLQNPELLILDEPTNHLDMRSKDVLKDALKAFDGTLIVVSHDRDFLDGLVEKVYEFGNQRVVEHLGGIYDFLERKKMDNLRELERTTPASGNKTEEQPSENKLSYEERKEFNRKVKRLKKQVEEAEATCDRLSEQLSEVEARLATPEGAADTALYAHYADLKQQVENAMDEWTNYAMELEETEKLC